MTVGCSLLTDVGLVLLLGRRFPPLPSGTVQTHRLAHLNPPTPSTRTVGVLLIRKVVFFPVKRSIFYSIRKTNFLLIEETHIFSVKQKIFFLMETKIRSLINRKILLFKEFICRLGNQRNRHQYID